MLPDRNRSKVILAVKRCIERTFDNEKWLELGYMTDTADAIQGHSRLLRSLYWNDDDYSGNVLEVVPRLLGEELQNLEIVEDYIDLEDWLRHFDPDAYAELYGGAATVPLSEVEQAAQALDVIELEKHAARIRRGIRDDPEQAIGSAKELLESTLKAVLGDSEQKSTDNIHELLRRAQKELNLLPRAVNDALPGADTIKRTLSNLGQVVVGVAEVRTLYGTGHGRAGAAELEIAHARLVVNAAVSVATFLLETHAARNPPPL